MSSEKIISEIIDSLLLEEAFQFPLNRKEEQIKLLKILFKHGYPLETFPTMSTEDFDEAIKITLTKLHVIFKETPSLVHWLQSKLFENTKSVSMALLFIEWYEQHPLHENNLPAECNYREIYHFLYKLTMNQVPAPISQKSAEVLYTLITEVLHEAWLDKQQELVAYCIEIFKYSRTLNRRVYQGKRKIPKKEQNV